MNKLKSLASSVKHPALAQATSNDATPTPGYLLDELSRTFFFIFLHFFFVCPFFFSFCSFELDRADLGVGG